MDNINEVLSTEESIDERNKLISAHGKATSMMLYRHLVTKIEYGDDVEEEKGSEIIDEDTIDAALAWLSSDQVFFTEFIKAVNDYINETTVSVIGVPVFKCPVCGTMQEANTGYVDEQLNELIPLNVIQTFFVLLGQRVTRINYR
jgi:hypothetical protein